MGNQQYQSDYIRTHIIAKMLDLSVQRVNQMLAAHVFKSAFKGGVGRNSPWKVLRSEVLTHKLNGHHSNPKHDN